MELTYPCFCRELQAKLDAHRAGTCHYSCFSDNEKDFWIIDANCPEGRPARELIMVLDNAAYHKGANCLLKSKTKDEIALLLRDNGISQIAVMSKVDGTEMNYLVPAPNDNG